MSTVMQYMGKTEPIYFRESNGELTLLQWGTEGKVPTPTLPPSPPTTSDLEAWQLWADVCMRVWREWEPPTAEGRAAKRWVLGVRLRKEEVMCEGETGGYAKHNGVVLTDGMEVRPCSYSRILVSREADRRKETES